MSFFDTKLNEGMLKKFTKEDKFFRETMKWFASRERGRFIITVPRLQRMLKDDAGMSGFAKADVIEVLEKVAKAGGGYFDKRTEGEYLWIYDLRSVGRAACGMAEPPFRRSDGVMVKAAPGERLLSGKGRYKKIENGRPAQPVDVKPGAPRTKSMTASFDESAKVEGKVTEGGNVIVFPRGDMEFEISLSEIPPGCIRFRRMLSK